ncbi:ABC-2 type transport system ATP-binding protein [Lentibacillus persicus]|uniref:ABC-2 type transport system ATP-binding protein n=1 Tax=Lentibacillus persicus TaxID=640948 RepID=A0A1I1ZDX3_9BACI|nr:ABC transporter ATP-binding protein [Lentibacillus persicus]SFE29951.1 ABC-2 type transport system ATP-binding protein [Lentibacillus persicus]
MLQIKDLRTEINQAVLLDGITFDIKPSSVTALVGHNGAGKSTLFKTVMGVMAKSEGEIWINERYNQEDDFLTFKQLISYLPEEPLLLTELTVMQHFQLYAMSYAVPEEKLQNSLERLVPGFELEDKLNEYPEALSKGMRQKVQTICALLPDTPLLFIDEPFMGLDIYAMEYLEELIQEKAKNGTSILLTTHQLERVKDIAENYIMLQHGRIQSYGPIADFQTIQRRSVDEEK